MSTLLLARLLPAAISDEEVTALRTDQGAWSPALSQICYLHGLCGPATVFPEGSAIVGATESHIIKLFEPWSHRRSRRCISTRRGRCWLPRRYRCQ